MATKTGKIKFIDFHKPYLKDGDYSISVMQTINAANHALPDLSFSETFPAVSLKFTILGPRYTLDPQLVAAVFPPPGSLGDHSNVLPHIVLNRSTLPWERTAIRVQGNGSGNAQQDKINLPWLALLLFDEHEMAANPDDTAKVKFSTLALSKLTEPAAGAVHWPGAKLENGQHLDDQVSVIDVPCGLLKKIAPSGTDLPLLAHVRLTEDELGKPGDEEWAVIIGNRLPQPGKTSIMHLVSLEDRYVQEGKQFVFDFNQALEQELIRLVSLKSWRFACTNESQKSFTWLLKQLNPYPINSLRLPVLSGSSSEEKFAESYLAKGCVPLPHAMREGNKTVSWYRGPLVPGANTSDSFELPVRSADKLVFYDDMYGVFDVSYAAAWELGRLLALKSTRFSQSLYHWKRTHARARKDLLNAAESGLTHLPFDGPAASLELPREVSSWFEHLLLLEDVPFNYLVPDERMLPPESMRFFQVDPLWLECLFDGAFSLGRMSRFDPHHDEKLKNDSNFEPLWRISGFLMRSDIVAGWPGLLIEGYDKVIAGDNNAPEKELLFKDIPVSGDDALTDVNLKYMLRAKLQLTQKDAPDSRFSLEKLQWLIKNHERQYKLMKRENGQIDVFLLGLDNMDYLFSIDISFETELNSGKVQSELIQLFKSNNHGLQTDCRVSVLVWLITDNQMGAHYWLEKAGQSLAIYRSYQLPLLRMARLSANVLICLFEGVVQAVDLHLKPETLHFGLEKVPVGFTKKLKPLPGRPAANSSVSVSCRAESSEERVIDIQKLSDHIKTALPVDPITPAQFALQMIEGTEKVRFYLSGAGV